MLEWFFLSHLPNFYQYSVKIFINHHFFDSPLLLLYTLYDRAFRETRMHLFKVTRSDSGEVGKPKKLQQCSLDAERLLKAGKVLYKQSLAKDGASKETNQKG